MFDLYRSAFGRWQFNGRSVAGDNRPTHTAKDREESMMMLRSIKANFNLVCGGLLLAALVFCAIFADFLAPYSPTRLHRNFPYTAPTGLHSIQIEGVKYPIRFLIEGDEYLFFGFL